MVVVGKLKACFPHSQTDFVEFFRYPPVVVQRLTVLGGDPRDYQVLVTDDRRQLEAALRDQGTWHTECDWDTMNKWEKDFENLNPRLQRWLRRVKPYRYADK